MPSTIGHAIAGATVAWTSDLWPPAPDRTPSTAGGLTLACIVLATAPDADLLFGVHRTFTHSFTTTAVIAVVAALVAARVRAPVLRVALVCAGAHASHLILDWLAADNYPPYGLQLLWPFSDHWFISGLDLFPGTRRQRFFSATSIRINMRAVARELLILGPIAWAVWSVRVKALARLAAQMARRDHSPQ